LKIVFKLIFLLVVLNSCSENEKVLNSNNLQEYINENNNRAIDEVIACAANANGDTGLTYVFYYPIEGASEIKYFETETLSVDKNDFSNYNRIKLDITDVFGGKLQRFSRTNPEESWCIVTYLTNGKLHKSNPIRIKNKTKPTLWKEEVAIEYPKSLEPKFIWSDFNITDNAIYFQVISDKKNNFISGTYTYDNFFQFYNINNVVLNINTSTPSDLTLDTSYNFTLMAVSEDNWVNLVLQKPFVTQ
jgi:hypothetical protein